VDLRNSRRRFGLLACAAALTFGGCAKAAGRFENGDKLAETTNGMFEVIDLKDWPLPMDDEPAVPAGGVYEFEHTRAWSRKIASADAFVFVTPQYNWGYPAPLKNALDHLYQEWGGKPATIVTYGARGGDKCSGQLEQVCEGLHMIPIVTKPRLVLPRDRIEANLGVVDAATEFAVHLGDLRQAFRELAAARKAP
jgi:NAD(P)H-dependent FMN reductase